MLNCVLFVLTQVDINLSGNVVILDEAHNIEDSSREAASFTVSSESLSDAVDDLINISEFELSS